MWSDKKNSRAPAPAPSIHLSSLSLSPLPHLALHGCDLGHGHGAAVAAAITAQRAGHAGQAGGQVVPGPGEDVLVLPGGRMEKKRARAWVEREKGGARAHHNAGAFLGGRRPPHASHGMPGVSSVGLSNQSDGRARPGPAVGLPNHPPTPNCERAKRKEKRKPPPPCAPSPVPLPHVLAVLPVLDDPARIAGVPLRHGASCVSQKGRRRRGQRETRCKKKNCFRSLGPPHALTLFFFLRPSPFHPFPPSHAHHAHHPRRRPPGPHGRRPPRCPPRRRPRCCPGPGRPQVAARGRHRRGQGDVRRRLHLRVRGRLGHGACEEKNGGGRAGEGQRELPCAPPALRGWRVGGAGGGAGRGVPPHPSAAHTHFFSREIGRASCRERV